jgi:hypothetical protein
VLVVVGVVTHDEPGFEHPERRWDHTPLTVSCYGYEPDDAAACSTVDSVIETINSRLGFTMLVRTDERDSDIGWTMNAPVQLGFDGPCGQPGECFSLHGTSGTYERCEAQTMALSGYGDMEWLAVYHGFGHCLGLAHDDYDQSIMRPYQRPTAPRTLPPWFSDHDRKLLRERYAPD